MENLNHKSLDYLIFYLCRNINCFIVKQLLGPTGNVQEFVFLLPVDAERPLRNGVSYQK